MSQAHFTDLMGYSAAAVTTLSFIPQAWQTWRSHDVSGISVGMYSMFVAGVALWLAYGVMLGERPIIVANAITLTLAATILAMLVRARLRDRGESVRAA